MSGEKGHEPDRRVGGYVLEGDLGRGGMGTVHRARQVATGAVRAVKLLQGAADPEALARFRREAEALARVQGEGIVPIHEVGVERGRVFLVLGLMSGGSLRERLEGGKRLPWREAAKLSVALSRALERCHAAGLVHRDLKPENVLFDDQDRPRLADFGCVRDIGATPLTETGMALGTPPYMAPEQLDGSGADAEADVYALGVLLYEAVAGRRPFVEMTSVLASLNEKRRAAFPSLRELVSDAPAGLDAVVRGALAPHPGDRPDAGELARELEALLAGKAAAKAPAAALKGLAALLVLALVLGAAASWRLLVGRPRERAEALARARDELEEARRATPGRADEGATTDAAHAHLRAARELLTRARTLGAGPASEERDLAAAEAQVASIEATRAFARDAVDQALEILAAGAPDPTLLPLEGRIVRARALVRAKRLDEAAKALGGVVHEAVGLERAELAEMQGDALVALGKPADALEPYRHALETSPPLEGDAALRLHAKRGGAAGLALRTEAAKSECEAVLAPRGGVEGLAEGRAPNAAYAALAPAFYARAVKATDAQAEDLLDAAFRLADPPPSLRAQVLERLRPIHARDEGRAHDLFAGGVRPDNATALARTACRIIRRAEAMDAIDPDIPDMNRREDIWRLLGNLDLWSHSVDPTSVAIILRKLLEVDPDAPGILVLVAALPATDDAGHAASAVLVRRALASFPIRAAKSDVLAGTVRIFAAKLTTAYGAHVPHGDMKGDELARLREIASASDSPGAWRELVVLHDVKGLHALAGECLERAAASHPPDVVPLTPAEVDELRISHLVALERRDDAMELAATAYLAKPGDPFSAKVLATALNRACRFADVLALFPDPEAYSQPDLLLEVGFAAQCLARHDIRRAARARLLELHDTWKAGKLER